MKYLLDTHTFLWWNMDDAQLSPLAKEIISDGANEIFLSAATAWEIAIKTARGRLELPEDPTRYVSSRMNLHGFQALPVQVHHAVQVYKLPLHHADPFDRLLIAQSWIESMPLISVDAEIRKYEVEVVW
ncbi:MAG: type II toxin-antitoxin system VapC family toxin [Anaerolineaceae bacterium]|jgi:PIN domain nuclease of toxin-antitoxin system|nr:MAG: type II toxin-antitoxin system VapC family toxin [Anaerolineaceae bacterium]